MVKKITNPDKLRIADVVLARAGPCPECRGTGAVPIGDDPVLCRVCHGSGVMAWYLDGQERRIAATVTEATARLLIGDGT